MGRDPELSLWDTISDRLEARHAGKLKVVRECLKDLAAMRPDRTATADDARLICSRYGFDRGNWLGSVWKNGEWETVGVTRSKGEGRHASMIRIWRLK